MTMVRKEFDSLGEVEAPAEATEAELRLHAQTDSHFLELGGLSNAQITGKLCWRRTASPVTERRWRPYDFPASVERTAR